MANANPNKPLTIMEGKPPVDVQAQNQAKAEEALFNAFKSAIDAPMDSEEQEQPEPEQNEVEQEQAEAEPDQGEVLDDADQPDAEQADDTDDHDNQTVEVNGQSVPIKELKAGYMKDADYRRKTSELAEQRKAVEKSSAEYEGKLQAATELLTVAVTTSQKELQQLQKAMDEADIDTDPTEYLKRERAFNRKREEVGQQIQSLRNAQNAQAEQQKAKMSEYAQNQLRILSDKLPALKSEQARKSLGEFVVKTYGFTPEQLQYAVDHQFAMLAHDAMQFRQLQEKGVKKAPKPMKVQGAKPMPRGGNENEQAKQAAYDRVMKSGRTDDLQAYFKSIL